MVMSLNFDIIFAILIIDKFSCPALFIAGGKSLLLGSNIMKYMREAFQDKMRYITVKEGGHHLLLDEPLELVDILNTELKKWFR